MKEEAIMLLCEAIVRQAAYDYLQARKLSANGNQKAQWKCAELERWFVSEWGDALCCGHGAYILQRLKEKDAKANKRLWGGKK